MFGCVCVLVRVQKQRVVSMLRNKEEVYNTWSKMQFLRLQTPDIKWESNVKCSTQDFISVKSGFNFAI